MRSIRILAISSKLPKSETRGNRTAEYVLATLDFMPFLKILGAILGAIFC